MLAAAPAVPVVAVPVLLTVAFVFLVSAVLAWGSIKLFDYTLGMVLDMTSDLVDGIPLVGRFASGKLRGAKQKIRRALGTWAAYSDEMLARFWEGMTQVTEMTADALAEFGRDTHDTIAGLVDGFIPGRIEAATKPLADSQGKANSAATARARAEARARSQGIDRLTRDLTAEKLAREQGIDATLARVGARIRGVERVLGGEIADLRGYTRRVLSRRISRLEAALAAGVVGGIAVAAITRVFPYWQCSNVRGFNRLLCRAPLGALDDLLGLSLLLVGSLNIEEFAREVGGITGAVSGVVDEWIVAD